MTRRRDPHRVHASRTPLMLLVLAVAAGCGHTEPFETESNGVDGPFQNRPPLRLTYNPQADRFARWLPDESAIVYSARTTDDGDPDICLRVVPVGGGTATQELCDRGFVAAGFTDRFTTPTISPDGTALYVWGRGTVPTSASDLWLVSAPAENLRAGSELIRLPASAPSGAAFASLLTPHWLSPTRLTFVGADANYNSDSTVSGHEVMTLDLAGTPTLTVVPGTANASSVGAAANATTLYFTIGRTNTLHTVDLATGAIATVRDFGQAARPRDLNVVGNRMALIVRGDVNPIPEDSVDGDPPRPLSPYSDRGGELLLIDLATGDERRLALVDHVFRRPAISPSGRRIVAEAIPISVTRDIEGAPIDTVYGALGDLYVFEVP